MSFLSALMLLTNVLFMGCENKTIQSNWTETSITIDGNSDDWAESRLEYNKENQAVFGFMNDQDNLYLLFRINDRALDRRSPFAMLTLWFDATNRKKKSLGISYSGFPHGRNLESQTPRPEDIRGGFWESLTEEQKEKLLKKRAEMQGMIRVIDKSKGKEEIISPGGDKGPAVGYNYEKGIIHTYELRIPINKKEGDRFGINVELSNKIALGFELGKGAPDTRRRMMGEGMQGEKRRGGMGRGMGGGHGREGRGEMGRQGVRINPEFWITVVLATNLKD